MKFLLHLFGSFLYNPKDENNLFFEIRKAFENTSLFLSIKTSKIEFPISFTMDWYINYDFYKSEPQNKI